MEILVQEQFGIRYESGPADREQNAVGSGGGKHASMKPRIARILNHDHPSDRLGEHLFERGSH
jgi:hypothetical protein